MTTGKSTDRADAVVIRAARDLGLAPQMLRPALRRVIARGVAPTIENVTAEYLA